MSSPSNQQRQHLKQEYGKLYDALARLLAEEDPMGLVRWGASRNEYEPEMDAILLRLHEATSPNVLGDIIYETFVEYFGTTFAPPNAPLSQCTREYFAALGEKAWTSWKHWQGETHQE